MNTPKVFRNSSLTVEMQGKIQEFRNLCRSIGLYGEVFLEEFDKSEASIVFSVKSPEDAWSGFYYAYDYDLGFINNIVIYENHIDDEELFKTIIHEGIHAIQANICAAALAKQYLDITPLDALKMMFAEELDTTAKENVFHFLWYNLEAQEDDLSNHNDRDYLVNAVQSHRMQSLFNNSYGCAEYGRKQREIYICRMLTTFEENIDYYKECEEFIKFTDIDIWEIGNSMGFNAFGKTAAEVNFQARMPMSDEQWARLRNIEKEIQLDQKKIISFSDYLKNRNMTRVEFLIEARSNEVKEQQCAE